MCVQFHNRLRPLAAYQWRTIRDETAIDEP